MSVIGLIEGLNAFHNNYFNSHRELFEQLSTGQAPEVLFITCSDSRIDPCLITQAQPGDLFVMRNVGNIIPAYGTSDSAEGAGIEYAVQGEADKLLKIAIEQNVLTQIRNLETYPAIRSKLHSGQLNLHAWIYEIESGTIFAYNAELRQFIHLEKRSFPVPDPLNTTVPA